MPALLQVLQQLVAATGARTVLWNRLYEPWCIQRDMQVESGLTGLAAGSCGRLSSSSSSSSSSQPAAASSSCSSSKDGSGSGVSVRTFNASLLYEPWDVEPDRSDEDCWNSGYGSVRFFLNACRWGGELNSPAAAVSTSAAVLALTCCAGRAMVGRLRHGSVQSSTCSCAAYASKCTRVLAGVLQHRHLAAPGC
jgi:hypothetical protein